ncbi:BLUF domain-containing protein [Marinomonas sp. 2405UD68-3]|uniref:BLUF domain-containing protein n=1 Tax=Marinomonas sp. 2405UD68-3 TaxID=3391835 RepID=UPI0039C9CD33
MISLAYISNASKKYVDDKLKHMFKDFQQRNARNNISSALLSNGAGTFIQVLEGDDKLVDTSFASIRKDIRHKSVYCLRRTTAKETNVNACKMGFRNLSKDALYQNGHFSNFLNDQELDHFIASNTDFALNVLTHFKNTAKKLNVLTEYSNDFHAKNIS